MSEVVERDYESELAELQRTIADNTPQEVMDAIQAAIAVTMHRPENYDLCVSFEGVDYACKG